jgi:hypothetical protein
MEFSFEEIICNLLNEIARFMNDKVIGFNSIQVNSIQSNNVLTSFTLQVIRRARKDKHIHSHNKTNLLTQIRRRMS